jgi:hypothetical protein
MRQSTRIVSEMATVSGFWIMTNPKMPVAQRQRIKELLLDDPIWVQETETKPRSGGRLEAMWRALRSEIKSEDGLITPFDIMRRLEEDPAVCAKIADQLPGRITLLATGNVPRTLRASNNDVAVAVDKPS